MGEDTQQSAALPGASRTLPQTLLSLKRGVSGLLAGVSSLFLFPSERELIRERDCLRECVCVCECFV